MKSNNTENTADQFVNVADIKEKFIFRKDNYLQMMSLLGKINIDLMTKNEKNQKSNLLASDFKSMKKEFDIISIPRVVNLEKHIEELNKKYNSELNQYKRKILSILIQQDRDIMLSGANYEHQFYFICYEPMSQGIDKAKVILQQRMNDYRKSFEKNQIDFNVLDKPELLKICNLFGNGEAALMYRYDDLPQNLPYSMIS